MRCTHQVTATAKGSCTSRGLFSVQDWSWKYSRYGRNRGLGQMRSQRYISDCPSEGGMAARRNAALYGKQANVEHLPQEMPLVKTAATIPWVCSSVVDQEIDGAMLSSSRLNADVSFNKIDSILASRAPFEQLSPADYAEGTWQWVAAMLQTSTDDQASVESAEVYLKDLLRKTPSDACNAVVLGATSLRGATNLSSIETPLLASVLASLESTSTQVPALHHNNNGLADSALNPLMDSLAAPKHPSANLKRVPLIARIRRLSASSKIAFSAPVSNACQQEAILVCIMDNDPAACRAVLRMMYGPNPSGHSSSLLLLDSVFEAIMVEERRGSLPDISSALRCVADFVTEMLQQRSRQSADAVIAVTYRLTFLGVNTTRLLSEVSRHVHSLLTKMSSRRVSQLAASFAASRCYCANLFRQFNELLADDASRAQLSSPAVATILYSMAYLGHHVDNKSVLLSALQLLDTWPRDAVQSSKLVSVVSFALGHLLSQAQASDEVQEVVTDAITKRAGEHDAVRHMCLEQLADMVDGLVMLTGAREASEATRSICSMAAARAVQELGTPAEWAKHRDEKTHVIEAHTVRAATILGARLAAISQQRKAADEDAAEPGAEERYGERLMEWTLYHFPELAAQYSASKLVLLVRTGAAVAPTVTPVALRLYSYIRERVEQDKRWLDSLDVDNLYFVVRLHVLEESADDEVVAYIFDNMLRAAAQEAHVSADVACSTLRLAASSKACPSSFPADLLYLFNAHKLHAEYTAEQFNNVQMCFKLVGVEDNLNDLDDAQPAPAASDLPLVTRMHRLNVFAGQGPSNWPQQPFAMPQNSRLRMVVQERGWLPANFSSAF